MRMCLLNGIIIKNLSFPNGFTLNQTSII